MVAAVPIGGRALVLYAEVHPAKMLSNPRVQAHFLRALKTRVIPDYCTPIVVADAGFRKDWFREIQKLGWDYLLDDARIALDNNATEMALRGIVVGRKNHYGSKSKRGLEVAALLYSLVESAKLVGLCPRRYLRDSLDAAISGDDIPLPHEIERWDPPPTEITNSDLAARRGWASTYCERA